MEDTFSATGSLCVPVDNDGCFTLSEHRHRRSTALVELKLLVARSKAAAEASLRPLASLLQSKKGSFRTLLGDFDRVVDAARSVCASQTLLQPVQTQPNQRRRGSVLPRSSRDAQDDRAPSASERQQRRDREVTIAELIVRCFLLGVPMELLQRLLQASILLQARHGRGCVPGSDVKRCETDGLAILQFFHHRLHSVLASSSDHPQLSWLVERTIASAQRVARGPSPAPSNDATSFEKRSSQTPVCANPMCLQKIQGHRYSHHGINAMRARRSAGRGLLRMDRLADPVFRDQTDDAGVGDGHRSNNRRRIRLRAKGRVCWKCATTPQAIFTTKQFPFGYKYCTSCRCFHKLLHFIDGQARARHHCGQANESAANNNAASALDQTGLEQEGADGIDRQATISIDHATGCVRSTCHASRQFYHMVDRPLAETCTQPSAVQSVGSTTDTATTIGPYSNPQHRHEGLRLSCWRHRWHCKSSAGHIWKVNCAWCQYCCCCITLDVQRFLHPRGQLWKHKSAALGSARRSHNRNLNSSQTAQPSRSSHLAKKVVKRVLLSASFLSANPDIVQSVDCSGQNALVRGLLLH